jgi:hypothetical protein
MRNIKELQEDIEKLPLADIERLAEWLAEYRAQAWDEQIAQDAKRGGPLRDLIDKAKSDFRLEKTRRLP